MFQNYILWELRFYQVPNSSSVVKRNFVLYIKAFRMRCKIHDNEIMYVN